MSFYQAVGCVAIAPVNEYGVQTGPELEVGEVGEVSVGITHDDPVVIKGRTCRTYGKVVASKPGEVSASGSMELRNYNAHNLALALDGEISTNNANTQTLTDQSVSLTGVGEFVAVGAGLLENVVVKNAASEPLTEGVDYILNAPWGLIAAAKETVANTEVKVSAAAAEDKSIRVAIGATQPGYYSVRVTARNTITGKTKKLYLSKVRLANTDKTVFVSDDGTDYEKLTLTMTPEIPTGGNSYGYVDGFALQ